MYVAAIDCGTTAIKAGIFDLQGHRRAFCKRICRCTYQKKGFIEQDAALIADRAFLCLKKSMEKSGLKPGQIGALSLSTQRATIICLDKKGSPLGRAISWQDMRGKGEVEKLREKINDKSYFNITGLPNNPVFSLAKILWLKNSAPALYNKSSTFALVHTYLLKELGAPEVLIDYSNASLSGIFDLEKLDWSDELLQITGIKREKLPRLVNSGSQVGRLSRGAAEKCGLLEGTPLISGGGDQQCAALGTGAIRPGIVGITLGTAAVSLTTCDRPVKDPERRIACTAHVIPGSWLMEGLQNAAGASLDWIKRIINEPGNFAPGFLKAISQVSPGAGGIYFFPYLAGASAPHWNADAKGMFFGLENIHHRGAIVRSVMEGVSMETRDIMETFASLRFPIDEIRISGGGTHSLTLWNQIMADMLGERVAIIDTPHATLQGAALLAASGAGAFKSPLEGCAAMVRIKKSYYPLAANVETYHRVYRKFRDLYQLLNKNGVFTLLAPER